MASNDLQFAIRAINEASKTLRDVQADVDKLGKEAETSSGRLGKFGDTLGTVSTVAGGFLAANVIAGGFQQLNSYVGDSIQAASDLGESYNAVNKVFEGASEKIREFGKVSATEAGLSERAFNQLATPLGAMLKNAGLSLDDTADSTIALTQRAADMASVFNTSVEDALTAIQAGLRGEADPLEKFGVGLSAAKVEAKALADTGKTVAKELTEQEKATARIALIMEQTNSVAGDFADTSDQLANKQRILAARQEETAAAIGEKLLPVSLKITEIKLKLAELIAEKVVPALERMAAFVTGTVVPAFSTFVAFLADYVAPQFARFQEYYEDNVKPAFENIQTAFEAVIGFVVENWPLIERVVTPVMEQVQNVVTTAVGIIRELIEIVIDLISGDFSGAWRNLGDLVGVIWRGIIETIENNIQLIAGLATSIAAAGAKLGEALFDGMRDALSAGGQFALDIAKQVGAAIKSFVNDNVISPINRGLEFSIPMPFGQSFTVNPPDIPLLARGGIVTRPTLAVIGEAGPEAVVPLSRAGGASGLGTSINLTINVDRPLGSPESIADAVMEGLQQLTATGRFNFGGAA